VVDVTGSGFGDVAPTGGAQHIYLALIPEGTDFSDIAQGGDFPSVQVTIQSDGTFSSSDFSGPFEQLAATLDDEKQYEVIAWPARSFPTVENLYTREAAVIDWATLFPPAPV